MLICPCKDCPNKGCGAYHSQCKEYISWKTKYDECKQRERQQKDFERSMHKNYKKGGTR